MVFGSATGSAVSYHSSAQVGPTNALANQLSLYNRAYIKATAPAGAVSVSVFVRKYNTLAGNGESYMWWAAPQLERVNSGVTTPSPYQPGPSSSTRQLGYSGDLNATYGAQAGSTLKDSSGAVLGDAAIKNSSITINAAGVLTGAGGGTVSLTGLGAGSMATINQITGANISTYIASAAISSAYIGSVNAGTINAGTMSAAYITGGTITADRFVTNAGVDLAAITPGSLNTLYAVYDATERVGTSLYRQNTSSSISCSGQYLILDVSCNARMTGTTALQISVSVLVSYNAGSTWAATSAALTVYAYLTSYSAFTMTNPASMVFPSSGAAIFCVQLIVTGGAGYVNNVSLNVRSVFMK